MGGRLFAFVVKHSRTGYFVFLVDLNETEVTFRFILVIKLEAGEKGMMIFAIEKGSMSVEC